MEVDPKRISPTRTKFAFLTESGGFSDETLDTRTRRAEFVQHTLRPTADLTLRIQDDIRGLDSQLKREVLAAFTAMKSAAEKRLSDAVAQLADAEKQLREQEDSVETCGEVASLRSEIELYTKKSALLEKQQATLEQKSVHYASAVKSLTETIQTKTVDMKATVRSNLDLHRAVGSWQPAPIVPREPSVAAVYRSVPFSVFMELSCHDVGSLTISEIQAFIRYKKHVEKLKTRVSLLRAKARLLQTSVLEDNLRLNLEQFFMLCVEASKLPRHRTHRSMPELEFATFPVLMPTDTMTSARLFSIEREQEISLKKKRKMPTRLSRKELAAMPVCERLSLVLARPDCVERLRHFLRHRNRLKPPFDQATELARRDTQSMLDTVETKRI